MSRVYWFSAIRTFGFAMILIYHLFISVLPGGFLGVDISFTLSGFLITAIILDEVRTKDDFNFFRFIKRRFQRIFIPLIFIVIFTLPMALLISPDFTVGIGSQLAATFGFVTNFREISVGSSYEAQLLPSMYIHTWSLAVEMHFYLLWGIACALIAMLMKKFPINRYETFRTIVFMFSAFIAVASFTHMIRAFNGGTDINAVYFNTFTRFFAFFIGAIAAAVWGLNPKQDERIKKKYFSKNTGRKALCLLAVMLGTAAFFVFFLMQFEFEDAFVYRYGFLISALLTVVMIYCAHGLQLVTPQKMKEPFILKASADMAYDMYLIHWPFYVVFSALIMNATTASFTALFATIVFAIVMYYGVERVFIPYKKKELKHKWRYAFVILALAAVASAGGISVLRRAPVITSIEADFASNYTLVDVYGIIDARETVSDTPVIYTALSANILPADTVQAFSPRPVPTPRPVNEEPVIDVPGGVTIIGCSVALGAQARLRQEIPDSHVDASGSRQVNAGHELLMELQESGELREYVVIALGTNVHPDFEYWYDRIVEDLNPGHRLIFVTPFNGQFDHSPTARSRLSAEYLRTLPQHFDFITIADWNLLIQDRQDTLSADRTHLGHESRIIFTDMVIEALEEAANRPPK